MTSPTRPTWSELSSCVDRALDLEVNEREAWLAELAVTQPALADEVRRFLAEDGQLHAAGFLENPPLDLIDRAVEERFSLNGQQVGAYTIEHLIGRGGMGEVWLASRSDGRFEARYAIKFLDWVAQQARLIERFHREGRLLGRLAHPHIARLIDAGVAADGRQYLVIEYVDGERIDSYCESHALSIDARVRLFLDVVAAVAHAHANLVVHRDLKPSNVLVTHDGMVKLLDFGIAKLLNADEPRHEATTRIEDIALTPEYAAPEQLLGDMPSTATDVYQLGMLLYVLLAGRHPLSSTGNRADRIKAALDASLPRASKLVEGAARKQLRGDLDAILSMALRKDPQERYATAAALRDDLQRYLRHEPVDAQRGATLYGLRKFVRRHRFAVAGSAVALLGLCAALVFAFMQARIAATERDRAFSLVSRNAAVTEFLGTVLTETAASSKPATVSDMLARGEKLALADAHGNPENRAAVLAMIAEQYDFLGHDAKARELLRNALALLQKSPDNALRAKLTCTHALLAADLGRGEAAARTLEHQIDRLHDDPETASHCLLKRALLAMHVGTAAEMLRYSTQALAQFHAAARRDPIDEAHILSAVANGHDMSGHSKEADRYFQLAWQKYVERGRERSTAAIIVKNNWANLFSSTGMPSLALKNYDEILRIVAEDNPGSTPSMFLIGNRASSLLFMGRFDEARQAFELQLQMANQENNLANQLNALMGLATIAHMSKDAAAAKHYFEQVMTLAKDIKEKSQFRLGVTALQARIELAAGEVESARTRFMYVLAQEEGRQSFNARLYKGEAELARGDLVAAANDARLALELAKSTQSDMPYSYKTGQAWLTTGRVLQQLGKGAEARQAFAAAVENLSNTVDERHPDLVQAKQYLAAASSTASHVE